MKKLITLIGILLTLVTAFIVFKSSQGVASPPSNVPEATATPSTQQLPWKRIDFSTLSPNFRFSASIPPEWSIEYIAERNAVSVYDPKAPYETTLDQSKI